MTNTRRMGVRNFGSKRLPRHLRNEELPKDNFTPRTYQVELLDSALHRNTIICMESHGRIFIAVMLMKEMAQTIRKPLSEGGKKTVFLVNTEDMIEHHKAAILHQTDLDISVLDGTDEDPLDSCIDKSAVDETDENSLASCIDKSEVLMLTGSTFLYMLQTEQVHMPQVNMLIFDECHLVVENHPYREIMTVYSNTDKAAQPRILGLTSAILAVKNQNPEELGEVITAIEKGLLSTAETSTLVLFERYGVKPREEVVECDDYEDTTGLSDQLADILENAIDFLDECNIEINEDLDDRDPKLIPKAALIECHNVLRELGPWCAACLADMLVGQIEKIEKQKEFVALNKKFLKFGATNLRMVSKIFEEHFKMCDYLVEELLRYSSPKVTSLMNCLRGYRPETDFVIISEDIEHEDEADEEGSEMIGMDSDMSDSDFSDNEDGDPGNKSESSKQVHVAIKKIPDDKKSADPFALDEDKYLCGLVFVNDQHKAYALNKFIEEVCAWDEGLCFVKSTHLTGKIEKQKKLYKKQEEILRKFRMQELNLLVSTNVLEEGIDIPKCNFVCRFDAPTSYKSYSLSKGRARARDASYTILIEEEHFDQFRAELKTYKEIEQVLIGRCRRDSVDDICVTETPDTDAAQIKPYVINTGEETLSVTLDSAIMLVNRYCAKLPSDAFTHLTPTCKITQQQNGEVVLYKATLRLPINSPIKQNIQGVAMHSKLKAKQAVALKMCEVLHKSGELDDNLMPVGKEMFQEEEVDGLDEEEDLQGEARPGTTKRKQYYCKKVSGALLNSGPSPDVECKLYMINMLLTGAITDEQNTRGRRIYAPEESPRGFGILTPGCIPLVPLFPVFTRSGEVTVSVELMTMITLGVEQLNKLQTFHRFLISNVLRLEKDPMEHQPMEASVGYMLVPLNREENIESSQFTIDWAFSDKVVESQNNTVNDDDESFTFKQEDFEDAVVMPSYRNMDQPQYFYVAEIRHDLNPQSPFPSPELYKTFAEYYTTKYGLKITNVDQPLLDVDHTSARLNLLIPRYMNQKGVALPTSSAETKKARRENLQQKQILVPELCDIHVFPASLWRKAVCLPAILYRMNYLLLAEEIRKNVAVETKIGIADLPENYRFPRLDFGFDTNPENLMPRVDKSDSDDEEELNDKQNTAEKEAPASSDSENNSDHVHMATSQEETEDEEIMKNNENEAELEQNVSQSKPSEIQSKPSEDMDNETSDIQSDQSSGADNHPEENQVIGQINMGLDNETSDIQSDQSSGSDNHPEENQVNGEVNMGLDNETSDIQSDQSSGTEDSEENQVNGQVNMGLDDEDVHVEGSITTSGYNELQRNCDTATEHNISNTANESNTQNDDIPECHKDKFHFVFHNNLEDPSSKEFINGKPACQTNCDKYSQNAENLHTFQDRGWDGDTDDDAINGENKLSNHTKCDVCSALSKEIGIDNLTITNCPECYKLQEKIPTSVQNGPSKMPVNEQTHELCNEDKSIKVKGVNDMHKKNGVIHRDLDHENDLKECLKNDTKLRNVIDSKFENDVNNSAKPVEQGYVNGVESDNSVDAESQSEHPEPAEGVSESSDTDIKHTHTESDGQQPDVTADMHSESDGQQPDVTADTHTESDGQQPDVTADTHTESDGQQPDVTADTHTESDGQQPDVTADTDDVDIFENIGNFGGGEGGGESKTEAKTPPKRLEDYEFPQPLIYMDEDVDMSTFVGPSPCIILQALTMSNANDFFSLERLETIGDSFLKYAITVYLYCSYPGIHEGKLSYLRSKQVSNYNLYRLGKRKGLAECMISTKFEPYENWLPSCYVINEDRRKGPVPKVSVASLSNKTSLIFGNGNHTQSEGKDDSANTTSKEQDLQEEMIPFENAEMRNFYHDMEEIDQIEEEEENETDNTKQLCNKNMSAYCLQVHHCLPDKSIADSVEALIGCYLTSCDKMAALRFMSWMGLKVLPIKDKSQEDAAYYERLPCPPSPFINQCEGSVDVLSHLLEGYEGFERKVGYTFKDRSYLLQAFTHASYHYNTVTDCYQRLEFLGDAVLDYVITRHLYEDSDKYTPGVLTDLRSALVNNNIFAALAVKWDFHKYFKAISPSLFYVIEKFVARQKDKEDEIDVDDDETDNDQEKEHVELEVPKALGDIFESVAGAIYLDSGMSLDAVWRVYYRIMKTQIDKYLKDIPKSPVRELLEQEPETAKFDKPERTMDGKIRVTVNVVGKGVFTGVGRNYRIAKSAAAKKALRCIKTLEQQGLI